MTRAPLALLLAVGIGGVAACSGNASNGGPNPTSPGSTSYRSTPVARGAQAGWTAYHANDARTGAVAGGPALTPSRLAWSVDLGGAVRGQPLVVDGEIIAATESNRVVALDPTSGKVLWSHTIGVPVRNVVKIAGCGNIDPSGITSTPVADRSTGTVYVVGEIDDGNGTVHHQLVGLDISTGRTRSSVSADPPLPAGERSVNLLQRAACVRRDPSAPM